VTGFAAIVLAGGRGRRLRGPDKPARAVAGRPMIQRVLDAVPDASPRVVVGLVTVGLPSDVVLARESPPGGGPVAAAGAGMARLGTAAEHVALLAADLPLLTPDSIRALRAALAAGTEGALVAGDPAGAVTDGAAEGALAAGDPDGVLAAGAAGDALAANAADGACYVDDSGRLQTLCGVWRASALRRGLARLAAERGGATLTGASMRALTTGLAVVRVPWAGRGLPPWFDCDTDDDLRRAEEWVNERAKQGGA
jgi:molybdopterin-guanine dinucleotide biosynthesis protein A